jgi:hypothetical protein
MKAIPFPSCLLALLLTVPSLSAAEPGALKAEASRHADNVIREIQLETTLEHYRHVRNELFKARLDDQMARLKASHSDQELGEADLAMRRGRLEILEETSARLERRIRELILQTAEIHAEAEADRAEANAHEKHGRWVGTSQDDSEELHLVLELEGDGGRFVIEEGDHRLTGSVEIQGEQIDLVVKETSDNLKEYVGKLSRGLCRRVEDRLAVVLNEPGRPERPTKLEAEGDMKGFLLERK